MEKKISEITVRMPESLKQDLQDVAAMEDRTLSEIIRIGLECWLYGHKHRHESLCASRESRHTMPGKV